jgi:hypothetical protein
MQKTFDHSKRRYRVSFQDHGRLRRKFFRTEAEADDFLKSRKEDVREFGIHWQTWTPRERAEIFLEMKRLRRLGWTLRAAVNFIEKHGKELCDVHGLSPSTAFAAISPLGRFREHLREVEGMFSWNPFPEAEQRMTLK